VQDDNGGRGHAATSEGDCVVARGTYTTPRGQTVGKMYPRLVVSKTALLSLLVSVRLPDAGNFSGGQASLMSYLTTFSLK
jgi:hypothetical protein